MANLIVLASLVCGASTATAADTYTVYVGPGGCDVAAKNCTEATGVPASSIAQYEWSGPNGDSVDMKMIKFYNTNGKPTWIHTTESCLFATLSDLSTIVSYQRMTDGSLSFKSNVTSEGISPVYLDSIDNVLLVANYHGPDDGKDATGASAATLKIGMDCVLTKGDAIAVTGHSINPGRQSTSHVHSVVADDHLTTSTTGVFFACDLGGDAVYTFEVDLETAMLKELHKATVKPGSGPRHTAVHPTERFAYIVHEMMSFVSVHNINSTGGLSKIQEVSTLPSNFAGFSKAAEILIQTDGSGVFVSNRGYGSADTNTIAGYKVQPDGTLILVGLTKTETLFPRGMEFSPDGKTLLVVGQTSDNLVTFDVSGPGELKLRDENIKSGLANPTTVSCRKNSPML
eukprot:m.36115 g.36115  ORF g.36115 m.36115 type:complete len:400 (-) comp17262_c0_seq1:602-1801(-)